MTDQQTLSGGCNCGAVRYALAGAPLAVIACHCTSCRRQSGAAFSVNLIVRADAMSVEGELASYMDPDTESGAPIQRQFCAACGSPIRSVPTAAPKMIALKAGSLDAPEAFAGNQAAMTLMTAGRPPSTTLMKRAHSAFSSSR